MDLLLLSGKSAGDNGNQTDLLVQERVRLTQVVLVLVCLRQLWNWKLS